MEFYKISMRYMLHPHCCVLWMVDALWIGSVEVCFVLLWSEKASLYILEAKRWPSGTQVNKLMGFQDNAWILWPSSLELVIELEKNHDNQSTMSSSASQIWVVETPLASTVFMQA